MLYERLSQDTRERRRAYVEQIEIKNAGHATGEKKIKKFDREKRSYRFTQK